MEFLLLAKKGSLLEAEEISYAAYDKSAPTKQIVSIKYSM
jgi:hypothetical protein